MFKAVHAFFDFYVNKTLLTNFFFQIVSVDNIGREDRKGDTHIFGIAHARAEEKVAEVSAEEASTVGGVGDGGVYHELRVEERSGGGRRIAGVRKFVAPDDATNTPFVFLEGFVAADEGGVSDFLAGRNLIFLDKIDGIRGWDTIFVALREASKFVAESTQSSVLF